MEAPYLLGSLNPFFSSPDSLFGIAQDVTSFTEIITTQL